MHHSFRVIPVVVMLGSPSSFLGTLFQFASQLLLLVKNLLLSALKPEQQLCYSESCGGKRVGCWHRFGGEGMGGRG